MRQIILDTETTGTDVQNGHRIIEIACLEMINRRLTRHHFQCYLNPGRDSDADALAVHGLSSEFLKDKPLFPAIADELVHFIKGAELIIHNAPFDLAFLDYELKLTNRNYQKITHYCPILDTLPLARQLHPGQRNSLDALCKRYQIDNSKREKHGALLDAELLAYVYLAMTGGQTSLFGGTMILPNHNFSRNANQKNILELPVLMTTVEEQMAHEHFLKNIKQTAGNCLWDALDTD